MRWIRELFMLNISPILSWNKTSTHALSSFDIVWIRFSAGVKPVKGIEWSTV
jgi:hypothetical protein